MNVILLALVIAFIIRLYVLIDRISPFKLRDANDIVLHILCGCAAVGAYLSPMRPHDFALRHAIAAAFLAEVFVFMREFLEWVGDAARVSTARQRRTR